MKSRAFGHLRRLRLRRRWVICGLVALALWLAARIDRAASQRPIGGVHPDVIHWGDVPITSILRREKDIFVVNSFGMFRTSQSDPQHRWQPVPIPLTIPFSGRFADRPPGTRDIYYCVGYPWIFKRRSLQRDQGLYVSHDDGGTWARICDRGDFYELIVCTGDHLYARVQTEVVDPATKIAAGSTMRIIASRDGGRTWLDISPPQPEQPAIIKRDPVNPSLIFIEQIDPDRPAKRTLIAADDRFQWTKASPTDTALRDDPGSHFMPPGTFDQRPGADLHATLRNFFDLPFGDSTYISVICLQPNSAAAYRFALDELKRVPFEIGLRRARSAAPAAAAAAAALPPPVVCDDADSNRGYQVNVLCPNGQAGFAFLDSMHWTDGSGYEVRYAAHPRVRPTAHTITTTQPYRRDLELNEFIPFRDVGDYRVQIVYTPSSFSPTAVPAPWTQMIASEPFTVTILPARGPHSPDFGWERSR